MTLPAPDQLEQRKSAARAWFERLRDDICAALEAVEAALPGRRAARPTAHPELSSARPGSAPITPAHRAAAARWP